MKEKVSELMDGALDERAAAHAFDALAGDAQAQDAWRTYHLIGDALRGTPPLARSVASRVAWRLQEEATVLAPGRLRLSSQPRFSLPAALAASFAALALVGWLAFAPQQPQPAAQVAQAQKAAQPELKPAPGKPQSIPLPSATPDYLLAHQGFSPRLSLQGMSAYARTVSDEAAGGRK